MHTALGMAVCRGDLRLIPAARNAPFCGSIQKMKHVPPLSPPLNQYMTLLEILAPTLSLPPLPVFPS